MKNTLNNKCNKRLEDLQSNNYEKELMKEIKQGMIG